MAKILDATIINGIVPRMLETSDTFIINSQVYKKETLEPIKLNAIYIGSSDVDLVMNTSCKTNLNLNDEYYSQNTIIIDKYNPEYSFSINVERSGALKIQKFKTNNDSTISLEKEYSGSASISYINIYSQDVNYIYAVASDSTHSHYIFKVDKKSFSIARTTITGGYSKIRMIKETPIYSYYAYSNSADNFYIGRYNKSNNSKTDIYNDNGTKTTGFYSFFRPMTTNDNEVLALRANKSWNELGIDNIILKKYIIDYDYEKVYSKNIELDCSMIPKGLISRLETYTYFTETFYFKKNDNEYFSFWNKYDKMLYLAAKTSENIYTIIQVYELSNSYYGVVPYNNGETLMMYNSSSIDFISFRDIEERYELVTALRGSFTTIGIDKNNTIWIQDNDGSVEMVGLNVPTIAEALFIDQELNYRNEDIETYIEVFCKNFNGNLIETDVEVFLNGPIKFSDTESKNKKIKTSANNTIRIPVTIFNSGLVETNVKII